MRDAALRGCLIAGITLWAGLASGQGSEPESKPPNQEAQPAKPEPTPAPFILGAEAEVPQSEAYQYDCDNPKDGDDSDLCAQWKAANAAKKAADWTKRQFFISAVETCLLVLTLGFSIFATIASWMATKAAIKAYKLSERGFCSVVGFTFDRTSWTEHKAAHKGFHIWPIFENSGESPILITKSIIRQQTVADVSSVFWDEDWEPGSGGVLIAPKTQSHFLPLRVRVSDLQAAYKKEAFVLFRVEILYTDMLTRTGRFHTFQCYSVLPRLDPAKTHALEDTVIADRLTLKAIGQYTSAS